MQAETPGPSAEVLAQKKAGATSSSSPLFEPPARREIESGGKTA